jgi:hypothetical protein
VDGGLTFFFAISPCGRLGPSIYLDSNWNRLDLAVVLEGVLSLCIDQSGYLSAIKTLWVLRPLRVIQRMPALKKVVVVLLQSLPAIGHVFFVLFSFLAIMGMLCVMLWSGTFSYRCLSDASGEWVDTDTLCYPKPVETDAFCRFFAFLNKPYTCGTGETCAHYGRPPVHGTISFDNLLMSILTLFTVLPRELTVHGLEFPFITL